MLALTSCRWLLTSSSHKSSIVSLNTVLNFIVSFWKLSQALSFEKSDVKKAMRILVIIYSKSLDFLSKKEPFRFFFIFIIYLICPSAVTSKIMSAVEEKIHQWQNNKIQSNEFQHLCNRLDEMCHIHLQLTNLSKTFNRIHSFQIMMSFVDYFSVVLFNVESLRRLFMITLFNAEKKSYRPTSFT